MEVALGEEFTTDTMVTTMMSSPAKWKAVSSYVNDVMSQKEAEERERQAI